MQADAKAQYQQADNPVFHTVGVVIEHVLLLCKEGPDGPKPLLRFWAKSFSLAEGYKNLFSATTA